MENNIGAIGDAERVDIDAVAAMILRASADQIARAGELLLSVSQNSDDSTLDFRGCRLVQLEQLR